MVPPTYLDINGDVFKVFLTRLSRSATAGQAGRRGRLTFAAQLSVKLREQFLPDVRLQHLVGDGQVLDDVTPVSKRLNLK